MAAFLHFGINTFTHKEMGDGTESPTLFNPTAFDARQWIGALKTGGFQEAMLTAKHHDGFCLWQTKCTSLPYSVAGSPFQGGQGDVVHDFVQAAHEAGLKVGLALSPFDRHEPTYGTPAYEEVFTCQLKELLTNYGDIDELWLWQAPGSPPFDWAKIRDLVHKLQPQALLELANAPAGASNDVHSIGLGLPGGLLPPADQSSLQMPTAAGLVYIPAEAVYSTRPSWFWHQAEDAQVKTADDLLSLYLDTVGRNSLFRLNVPPDTRGLLPDPDVAALSQLGKAVEALYRTNVTSDRPATADSVFLGLPAYAASAAVDGRSDTFWAAATGKTSGRLEIDLGSRRSFDLVSLQEPIALGERAKEFHLEARVDGVWTTFASGTTIGERKLFRFAPLAGDRVALVITGARGAPAISELGVFDTTAMGAMP